MSNIDFDHYLVAAKMQTHFCATKNTRQQTEERWNVEKLTKWFSLDLHFSSLRALINKTELQIINEHLRRSNEEHEVGHLPRLTS